MFPKAKTLLAAACLLAAGVSARAAAPTPALVSSSTGSINVSWTGGTAPFIAALSTTPAFTVTTASGTVASSPHSFPGIAPDTTYYFKVKSAGDIGQYSSVLSTATRVATPSGIYSLSTYFTADSSHTAAITVGWDTGGNPEYTPYELLYADNAGFTTSTTVVGGYPPVMAGGLNANTTYYFKVRARGLTGAITPYTGAISTSTLAMRLTGVGHTVHETTAAVSWNSLNDAGVQALRSQGYRLNYSLNTSMIPPVTWSTADPAVSSRDLAGLLRNTTYYYQAGALNHPGLPNMSEVRSFTTLGARPQGLARLAVADGSARLGWTALAPADAMGYRLEASTSNFAGGVIESSASYIAGLSTLTITTLYPNTTYYFRTASLNTDYAPNYSSRLSSVTLALPVSADLTWPHAYPHEVAIDFIPLQAAPQHFASEGYRLEAATAPFGSGGTIFSSATYTYQDTLRSLAVSGLAANTTYYLRLATLNWENTPNYTLLPSTRTGFPLPLSGVTLDSVWSSSAALSYTPNSAAQRHVAEASVHRFFGSIAASSSTADPALTGLAIEGLDENTLYYFRVGALYNGTTIYSEAAPLYRQTLPKQLLGVTASGVYQSSVTVTWSQLGGATQADAAERYLLEAAANPSFAPVLFSSETANINLSTLALTGLASNASYYFRAGTINLEGYVNYSPVQSTATLCSPPVQQVFNLTPNSMTPKWLFNSNPADTRYLVELDDNADFSPILASSVTVLSSATFSGLGPNTTYYTRVTAINRLNRAIPPVTFSAMATAAYPPAALAATGITNYGLTANWGTGGNTPLVTWYTAYISSSSDLSGTVHSSTTRNLSASFTGLVSDASYYLRVSALNLTGVPTDPATDLGAALTLPTTPYLLAPDQTFFDPMLDGFSVRWEPNGNSSHTYYYVQASTMADYSVINSSRLVNALNCTFSDLQIDTTYWVRVQARGQAGTQTQYSPPPPYPSAADVERSTRTLFSSQKNATAQTTNEITLETSYGTISVLLPQGSIGSSTRLTLAPVSVFAPPASAVSVLTPTGIGISLTYFPPTLVRSAITINIPYRASDLPAGIDRTRLVIALYDEANAVWVPLPSVSDTANNRVSGQTWHLSTFQIMQAQPETGLAGVKIYPNPYRPNSVSDVMHFTNLPALAKVRLYTFLGELVRTLKADVNGMAHWDGLNDDGRKAASGVYIAFIQTKGKTSSKSFKVALER
ncbi:MAG: fibronectin type III domain-containing protein [Elusimicrobiales bacterium]|nr:fibronectin type III domain-containing protein [Elusimicrobiales bacterium]